MVEIGGAAGAGALFRRPPRAALVGARAGARVRPFRREGRRAAAKLLTRDEAAPHHQGAKRPGLARGHSR
jgi:hypothetical protein